MKRRTLLTGVTAAAAGIVAVAAGGYTRLRGTDEPVVPDAPLGDERLEQRESLARGRTVDFYTAVPAGHGDGRGLPVCLVLHGASKTAADFPALGLGRFVTDSVRRGNAPFVLAGATGGRLSWRSWDDDDPQRMVHEEIPAWCAERGFATTSFAAWGWSMGGYGSLLLASRLGPDRVAAIAAESPALWLHPGDSARGAFDDAADFRANDVFTRRAVLSRIPIRIDCGIADPFHSAAKAFASGLHPKPVTDLGAGNHSGGYWRRKAPKAIDFVGKHLTTG